MASLQPIGGFAGNPSPQPISAEETQADGDKAGDQPPPVVQSTKNRYVIERRSDIDKEIVEGNRRERRSSAVVMWGTKLGQISPESYKMVVEKRKELEQRLYNHNRQSPYHRKISILAFHCRTNSWTLRTFLWINTQTNSPIMAVFP